MFKLWQVLVLDRADRVLVLQVQIMEVVMLVMVVDEEEMPRVTVTIKQVAPAGTWELVVAKQTSGELAAAAVRHPLILQQTEELALVVLGYTA
jgi:hypothetical protein